MDFDQIVVEELETVTDLTKSWKVYDDLEQFRYNQREKKESRQRLIKDLSNEVEQMKVKCEQREEQIQMASDRAHEIEQLLNEIKCINAEIQDGEQKIKECQYRKMKAATGHSSKDIELLEEMTAKLKACCTLTGIRWNPGTGPVSSGYVVNESKRTIKFFDVENLSKQEATKKIWETMEKSSWESK